MKHTPGPWQATRDTDARGNPCWRIDAPTVSLLAVLTYMTPGERAEGIGDAKLIAAAPKLLAALQTLAHTATHFPDELSAEHYSVKDALAAIAEAGADAL